MCVCVQELLEKWQDYCLRKVQENKLKEHFFIKYHDKIDSDVKGEEFLIVSEQKCMKHSIVIAVE